MLYTLALTTIIGLIATFAGGAIASIALSAMEVACGAVTTALVLTVLKAYMYLLLGDTDKAAELFMGIPETERDAFETGAICGAIAEVLSMLISKVWDKICELFGKAKDWIKGTSTPATTEATANSATIAEGGSGTVNPKDVKYMQSSINNQTGEYTVLDNVQALKDGTLKPSDLPEIRIWKDSEGNLWTLDHRRLAAFRMAGVDEVPFRWATNEEVASQMWKMTTQTGGTSIKLKLGNGKWIIIND